MKKRKLVLIIIAIIINTLFVLEANEDELWCFGFAYNVANGLIPYKDFNMVVTPLFALLNGAILYIFNNISLIYYVVNAAICTYIIYLINKKIGRKAYLLLILLFPIMQPNYSILSLMLTLLAISLDENKKSDILIGVILGLIILTKQTIGVLVLIASLLMIPKKQIFKRLIGVFIPSCIFLVYLIITHSFNEFIDYTVLGLLSFSKNSSITWSGFIIWLLFVIIGYIYYKKHKDKSIYFKYAFIYLFTAVPIFDFYHIIFSSVPFIVFLFSKIKLTKKYILLLCVLGFVSLSITPIFNIYKYYKGYIETTNEFDVWRYRYLGYDNMEIINKTKDNIKSFDGYNIFVFANATYLIKMEANLPINKYDLINYGNMGYNGEKRYINEIDNICTDNKCLFITYEENSKIINQQSKEIISYIWDNYDLLFVDGYAYYVNNN